MNLAAKFQISHAWGLCPALICCSHHVFLEASVEHMQGRMSGEQFLPKGLAAPTNFLDGSCDLSMRQLQAAQLRHMGQCPDLCLRLAGQSALATAGPELQRLGCHCRSEVHLRCNGELCSSFSQSDCLGTPWNPFGTCGKCAWGLGPSTHYEKCIASEPVGTRHGTRLNSRKPYTE